MLFTIYNAKRISGDVSAFSIFTLLINVIGFVLFVLGYTFSSFTLTSSVLVLTVVTAFFAVSFLAVVLPPISKIMRVSCGKKGQALEIAAIIIAGLDICVFQFFFTEPPVFVFCLGWLLCGLIYWLIILPANK